METRHVKLDYEDSLASKKQLLSSELNLLRVIRRVKAYRILRKREHVLKNDLKAKISFLKSKISSMENMLPELDSKKNEIKKAVKTTKEKEKKDVRQELEDIQEKLARLG